MIHNEYKALIREDSGISTGCSLTYKRTGYCSLPVINILIKDLIVNNNDIKTQESV